MSRHILGLGAHRLAEISQMLEDGKISSTSSARLLEAIDWYTGVAGRVETVS